MTAKRSFASGVSAMIVTVVAFACLTSRAADDKVTQPEEREVTFSRISTGEYQNFLANWDEKKQAVLYALVQTPARYKTLFHPAPVMGAKRPFAPEADLFAKEQILIVARMMTAPENMDKVFSIERVSEKDQELALHYRFNEPKNHATYSVKNYLAVRVPRHDYKKVRFFENGKPVGELNTAEDQWSAPAMTPEPGKAGAGDGK